MRYDIEKIRAIEREEIMKHPRKLERVEYASGYTILQGIDFWGECFSVILDDCLVWEDGE